MAVLVPYSLSVPSLIAIGQTSIKTHLLDSQVSSILNATALGFGMINSKFSKTYPKKLCKV